VLLAAITPAAGVAGEIPGLAPQFPPFIEREFGVTIGNDFFGRGGASDNFRTQQVIIDAKLTDEWLAVVDHSILTLGASATPARVDQLSASLGYHLVDSASDRLINRLAVGGGIRSVGNFAGQRIQNGFHRLVESEIKTYPYVDEERTDVTAWFDANHYRQFADGSDSEGNARWQKGYWIRASSLVTSDGQWDSAAGIFFVASRPAIDFWLGMRRDWRNGYDDPVLRETALVEDDTAVVLGARFGPIVFETVQQLNNDASYGQVRLVSGAAAASQGDGIRFGIEGSILVPDVQLKLTGRYPIRLFSDDASGWRESLMVAASYGEPQYGDDPNVFVRSSQFDVGLDVERPLSAKWLSVYGSATAGWREESLSGANMRLGEHSGSVARAVLSLAAGLRFDTASLGERWRFRIQLGLNGRLPVEDALLQIGDTILRVQEPALDIVFGLSLEFE
jgi:hypothetical protein